jgi:DNA-binding protein HU-beta
MIRRDVVRAVCKNCHIPKRIAELVVDYIFSLLSDTIARGEDVWIRPLGLFSLYTKPLNRCKNNFTGADVQERTKHQIKFTPSKKIRESILKMNLDATKSNMTPKD